MSFKDNLLSGRNATKPEVTQQTTKTITTQKVKNITTTNATPTKPEEVTTIAQSETPYYSTEESTVTIIDLTDGKTYYIHENIPPLIVM
jgi:hypothetical protein